VVAVDLLIQMQADLVDLAVEVLEVQVVIQELQELQTLVEVVVEHQDSVV
jgi:hypothetical protein|tara:strand:+ start:337 stop:486 length:150 start_codon:yes stop_codon:yes gene_type:complete